jgi:hypothetical protein
MIKKIKSYQVFILFFLIFIGLFSPYWHGIGNYWDWTVPYFSHQWWPAFVSQFSSWQSNGLGSPMPYQSWFSFQAILAFLGTASHLKPEYFIIIMLSLILSLTSFAGYLLFRSKAGFWLSLLAALALMINPAIYYKLLAGHVNYLFSYMIFLWLIYFLVVKLDPKKFTDTLVLGLLFAFVGVQIQFIFFTLLFCLIFFLFQKEKFRLIQVASAFGIALLVNLPWLSNYLLGVNSIASNSGGAANVAFLGSMETSIARIGIMAFSSATQIAQVYPKWALAFFGVLTLAVVCGSIYFLIKKKASDKLFLAYGVSLLSFVLLATGKFNEVAIPGVKLFYPMFREVGHFAPIVVALIIILIVKLCETDYFQSKVVKRGLILYLMIFVGINALAMVNFLPKVNYSQMREKFDGVESFNESTQGVYRVLSYPFWNQYGVLGNPDLVRDGYLLNNSGWDNYLENSSISHLSNYQAGGSDVRNTLQYRLLATGDTKEIEKRNVCYIFDFSNIYQSNFEKYTPADTYGSLLLIKNNPVFQRNILANTSNVLVAPNIIKLGDCLPRIYLENINLSDRIDFQRISSAKYEIKLSNVRDKENIIFLDTYDSHWKLSQADSDKSLFKESHKKNTDFGNLWQIDFSQLYLSKTTLNADGTRNFSLELTFWPQNFFILSVILCIMTILATVSILCIGFIKNRKR